MKWNTCITKKVRYRDKELAWNASVYYFTHLGTYSTPYPCNLCNHFHLTTKHNNKPSKSFISQFNNWFGQPILKEE